MQKPFDRSDKKALKSTLGYLTVSIVPRTNTRKISREMSGQSMEEDWSHGISSGDRSPNHSQESPLEPNSNTKKSRFHRRQSKQKTQPKKSNQLFKFNQRLANPEVYDAVESRLSNEGMLGLILATQTITEVMYNIDQFIVEDSLKHKVPAFVSQFTDLMIIAGMSTTLTQHQVRDFSFEDEIDDYNSEPARLKPDNWIRNLVNVIYQPKPKLALPISQTYTEYETELSKATLASKFESNSRSNRTSLMILNRKKSGTVKTGNDSSNTNKIKEEGSIIAEVSEFGEVGEKGWSNPISVPVDILGRKKSESNLDLFEKRFHRIEEERERSDQIKENTKKFKNQLKEHNQEKGVTFDYAGNALNYVMLEEGKLKPLIIVSQYVWD